MIQELWPIHVVYKDELNGPVKDEDYVKGNIKVDIQGKEFQVYKVELIADARREMFYGIPCVVVRKAWIYEFFACKEDNFKKYQCVDVVIKTALSHVVKEIEVEGAQILDVIDSSSIEYISCLGKVKVKDAQIWDIIDSGDGECRVRLYFPDVHVEEGVNVEIK